jgi:putative hemolysin
MPVILQSFHNFYPICKESVDDIIGVLDVKAYFSLENRTDKQAIWKTCVKKPFFVPETIKANVLFQQMKQNNSSVAIVLDEYGGVHGLVTFADILEQIVGTYNDQPENTANIVPCDNGWKIAGATPISEVNETLHTDFPEDEYETFGGIVFGRYGCVPDDDSQFTIVIDNFNVQVNIIKDHKIEEAFVSLRPQDEPKGETT